MNQILPQSHCDAAASAALVSDFFNMSANVQNMLKNQEKSHQAKRLMSTSQGPGAGSNAQAAAAFHSTGYHHRQAGEGNQKVGSFNHPQMNMNQLQNNQDFLQRGFANLGSPVNDRSGAIHQLIMQNANLKQINKPKSATGHRISGKQSKSNSSLTHFAPSISFCLDRFKNLNNSGRFVGQNSTIIHSAYN